LAFSQSAGAAQRCSCEFNLHPNLNDGDPKIQVLRVSGASRQSNRLEKVLRIALRKAGLGGEVEKDVSQ
jgi:hypothetical protein